MPESVRDVTSLLERLAAGDAAAEDELLPRVYRELHALAMMRLQGERQGHTLQATALVNEAYVRLCRARRIDWKSRSHFFAVAARVMRNILTDYARHRRTQIHATGTAVEINSILTVGPEQAEIALIVSDLLDQLALIKPRQAQVVEMRFYAGLTEEEIGSLLGLSSRTIKRDWLMARAWLYGRIKDA